MAEIVPTLCRLCIAHCGVLATVEDDNGRRKVTKVTGDPDNPLFKGYTCPKGRALPELHNHKGRLLNSIKRNAQGQFEDIASDLAAVEVAEKIKSLTGLTYIEFIRDYRLSVAKQLIQENGYSVSEACYKVGYTDRKYFSKLFKNKFKENPSFYLKS